MIFMSCMMKTLQCSDGIKLLACNLIPTNLISPKLRRSACDQSQFNYQITLKKKKYPLRNISMSRSKIRLQYVNTFAFGPSLHYKQYSQTTCYGPAVNIIKCLHVKLYILLVPVQKTIRIRKYIKQEHETPKAILVSIRLEYPTSNNL